MPVRLWDVATGEELHELTGHVVEGWRSRRIAGWWPGERTGAGQRRARLGHGDRQACAGAARGPGDRGQQVSRFRPTPAVMATAYTERPDSRLGTGDMEGAGRVQGPPQPCEWFDLHPRRPAGLRRPGHDRAGVDPGRAADKPFPAASNTPCGTGCNRGIPGSGTFPGRTRQGRRLARGAGEPHGDPGPETAAEADRRPRQSEFTVREQATKDLRELGDRPRGGVLRDAAQKSESSKSPPRPDPARRAGHQAPRLKNSAIHCGPWNSWNGSPPPRPANNSATRRRVPQGAALDPCRRRPRCGDCLRHGGGKCKR